ncbi:semaphorin-7A isoform X2 [Brachyhypopomus gauderio]|uniref:semaphorin-7A isoform X2 n=1 Tax=Brachyhypopomus gauderio TaxID=698409 RepID=UPI0040437174
MKFFCQSLFLGLCSLTVFCSMTIPRLILRQGDHITYQKKSHTVFYSRNGSDILFVGGSNYVLKVDVNNAHILENITLPANTDHLCEGSCENVVTVIEELQDYLFVCGTNGEQPVCWKLNHNDHTSEIMESLDGTGISPYVYSQNYLTLVVDGDLYAAAPLYRDGTSLQFRRKAGNRVNVWMSDPWIEEPTFISAFYAKRTEDPINEKIYILFREKNPDNSPEADPWLSRVARVCKADQGGPKRFLQNIWTSFLKARLVCAISSESLYFNRLQDAFVLHAEDWRASRLYALFSSSWNSTAVCIYSLSELDGVFETSSFKGYSKGIPNPRPGTCVKDSRSLPSETMNVIKRYPEMTDWIRPIQIHSPFYISNYNYTNIVVDSVQATDDEMYNVVLLSTDTGTIHKILEYNSTAFIISELHLYNGSAPVQTMKLNSKKRKLFVGYPGQMSVLDLHRCQDYNTSCQDCVLARDPYCAWTEHGCTSQIRGGIQNIATGRPQECPTNLASRAVRTKRHISSSSAGPLITPYTVPRDIPIYLSCPIKSYHATYTWMHNETNETIPCQLTKNDCLHLIPAITTDKIHQLLTSSDPSTCLLDPVPSTLFQKISRDLLPFISATINNSLVLEHVPTVFKTARVVPILKKATLDSSNISNYRPVSLPSFLSKTLE